MTQTNTNGIVKIGGREYTIVAKRLVDFRERHGLKDGWGIETELLSHGDKDCLCRAKITDPSGKVIATGHAYENEQFLRENMIGSLIEVAETSAVGRALAFCGFGGSEIASAEDVRRATPQVNLGPKKKREIIEAILKAVELEDATGLLQAWDELEQEEQRAIWPDFRSYERSAIKSLIAVARDETAEPDISGAGEQPPLTEKDQRRSEARDKQANK